MDRRFYPYINPFYRLKIMRPFIYLYITIFILFIAESRQRNVIKKNSVGILGLVIVFLFIALRSKEVGTDTITYVDFFHNPNFFYHGNKTDIGFEYIGRFLHLFGSSTEYFIFFSSAVMCFGLFFLIYKYAKNINFTLLLFCLVGTSSINLFHYMCMVRQCCALTFFFFAMYYLFEYGTRKWKTVAALYIMAILTHGSILFTVPFILLIWKCKISKKIWMSLIFGTYIIAALGIINVGNLLDIAFSYVGGLTSRDYSGYADANFGQIEQRDFFNMNILPFTVFGGTLCYMSKEYDLDYWPVKFFLISILLNNIFSDNLMWARLILPFSLLVIIAVPYLASKLKKKYVIPFYAVFFTYYIYKTVSQLIGMSSPFALGNIVVPYETWLFK